MGRSQKTKGARGEIEAAKFFTSILKVNAYRTKQYKGGKDSPDISGIPNIHVEVKHGYKLKTPYKWLEGTTKTAIEYTTDNQSPLIIIRAEELIDFCCSSHFQVKYVTSYNIKTLREWVAQANNDAGNQQIPLVYYRANREKPLLIIEKKYVSKLKEEIKKIRRI